MSNEDLEGIESEITNLNMEISKLSSENQKLINKCEELTKIIKNSEIKAKMELDKNEGLHEKIKILQNTIHSFSHKTNEKDLIVQKLNQELLEIKIENSNLINKLNTLQDELEINNKNVKKNFSLECTIKDLTEENENLFKTLKSFQNSKDYKMKYQAIQSELKETIEKNNLLNNSFLEINQ
jgi:hypothetical protein